MYLGPYAGSQLAPRWENHTLSVWEEDLACRSPAAGWALALSSIGESRASPDEIEEELMAKHRCLRPFLIFPSKQEL